MNNATLFAAFTLAKKLGWHGFYCGGSGKKSNFYVSVTSDDSQWQHGDAMARHARLAHDKPYGFEKSDWFYIAGPIGNGESTEF